MTPYLISDLMYDIIVKNEVKGVKAHMLSSEKILLVDDEAGLLNLLKITLEKERYTDITCAMTATEALKLIQENTYDVIVLDVMLPDFSGFDLCTEIRKFCYTPIIFLTACGTDLDKLTGLTLGGDDYMTKPFNPLEVVARIKAILRRQNLYHEAAVSKNTQQFDYGSFQLNMEHATLIVEGKEEECTAKEFELLCFFCQNPNHIFTATKLYEAVWNEPGYGVEKTIAMHISKLRKKTSRRCKITANFS